MQKIIGHIKKSVTTNKQTSSASLDSSAIIIQLIILVSWTKIVQLVWIIT